MSATGPLFRDEGTVLRLGTEAQAELAAAFDEGLGKQLEKL